MTSDPQSEPLAERPRRRVFYGMLALVVGCLTLMIWSQGLPHNRYDGSSCQYQLTYGQTIEPGLYTVGGSVMMTATDADDFNAYLAVTYPSSAPVLDAGHTYFSIEKEMVLIRDFLETQTPRSILVMMRPRRKSKSQVHDDFLPIVRLGDIPLAMQAIGAAYPLNALDIPSKVLRYRLASVFEESDVRRKAYATPTTDCHGTDYRLNLEQLEKSQLKLTDGELAENLWDLDAPKERINYTYIAALKEMTDAAGVPLMMMHLPMGGRALPEDGFAAQFAERTGVRLLMPDQALLDRLNEVGRRDLSHINALGRTYFLPWLTEQIRMHCPEGKTCL